MPKTKEIREMRHLSSMGWHIPKELDMTTNQGINVIRSTVIVGDGEYNGEFYPAEELEKAYKTMDNQPFNLNHSSLVEDEIGYVKKPMYDPETHKMSVQPVINGRLGKAKIAKDYIENRRMANKYAEVSVGVYVTPVIEELEDENGETIKRITCRDLEFDHLALVSRGACSPADGAGIGLSKKQPITIDEHMNEELEYIELNEKDLEEEQEMPDEEEKVEEKTTEEEKPEEKPKEEEKKEEIVEEEPVEESKNKEVEDLKKQIEEMKQMFAKRKTKTYSDETNEEKQLRIRKAGVAYLKSVSYTHLRAHET